MLINILYTVPYFILKHVYRNLKRVKDDFIYKSMQIINQYSPNMHIPDKVIPLYYHAFHNKLVENLDVKEMKKVLNYIGQERLIFIHIDLIEKQKKKHLKQKIENNYYLEPLVYFSRRQVHKVRKIDARKTKRITLYGNTTRYNTNVRI